MIKICITVAKLTGIETTSSALASFVGLMAGFPKIQQQIQEEIDNVIGQREPSLSDRENMPFVEATIFELLRYADPVTINLPHATTSEQTLGGYTLPKATIVSSKTY